MRRGELWRDERGRYEKRGDYRFLWRSGRRDGGFVGTKKNNVKYLFLDLLLDSSNSIIMFLLLLLDGIVLLSDLLEEIKSGSSALRLRVAR